MKSLIEQFPDSSEQARVKYKRLHPKYEESDDSKGRFVRLLTVAIGCLIGLYILVAFASDSI